MNRQLLLVEDDPDHEVLTLRALNLKRTSEVIVARDGEAALDFLLGRASHEGRDTRIQPGLVLLDLKLPKVSGLEVLAEIRRDARTCHIPVVVFTSSTEDRDLTRAYRLGVNSYLQKPTDFRAFKEVAKTLGQYWLEHNQVPDPQYMEPA